MNIEMSKQFYEARNAYEMAKGAYQAKCQTVKRELVEGLPTRGEGVTAAELSAQTGLESRDVARLLSNFTCGKKIVSKTYVLIDEKGTVDYSHQITKHYRVNTYARIS